MLGQRLISNVIPQAIFTLFLETESLAGTWTSLIGLGWLVSRKDLLLSATPVLGITSVCHNTRYFWGLNFGLHV